MRIVIVGAGQVGFHLADKLSRQGQDVTVVDADPERGEYLRDRLDVLTVEGNGTAIPVLEEAGLRGADLFLAVTNSDEVNLIGCLAADRMGVGRKVARISNPDLFIERSVFSHDELGIDLMINPERECAWETLQLLRSEVANELLPFAGGRVHLVGLRLQAGAPVVGRTIEDAGRRFGHLGYTTAAIRREGRTEIATGDFRLETADQVFVFASAEGMGHLSELAGYTPRALRRVMIAGGSQESIHLARYLEVRNVSCTILDIDRGRCVELSKALPRALVLQGDGTDADLLEMEGVAGIDGFVAFTNNDETNLLSCLLASRSGARKVVSLLRRRQYFPLASRLGIDATVSPRLSAANTILRYVHTANVSSVAALREVNAEALEVRIGPRARVLGRPFREVAFPERGLVGAIIRKGTVIMPRGDDFVQSGDRVVLFAATDAMPALEKLFA